jgi:hypothetical protein
MRFRASTSTTQAGLPDDTFSRTERGLNIEEYIRFWRALEVETNDPAFPLPLVERALLKSLIRRRSAAPT